jgi:hypothetical protein
MAYNLETHVPNTAILSGRRDGEIINDLPVIAVGAKPGMFVEGYLAAGNIPAWRPHSNAVNQFASFVLMENEGQFAEIGQTWDTVYNSGDNALVHPLRAGMKIWAILPSGQNIASMDLLQSNGDGRLKAASAATAAANVARLQALEAIGPTTVDTRIRVQVI